MLPHVHSAADLITSRAAIRGGFLKQALAKTQKAASYILEARELAAVLQGTEDIQQLAHVETHSIKNALLAAAGFSNKARGKMSDVELEASLAQILQAIAKDAPDDWRTEIVYRFLLTRGDTLGGSMRNVTGAAGGIQLTGSIASALQARNIPYHITPSAKNAQKVVSLEWTEGLLVFDRKPRFLDKSVDVLLLDRSQMPANSVSLEIPASYLACGELKGGIDPAGADEHWKTARSAFDRIRECFTGLNQSLPKLFFVGAAIEKSMAEEIFTQLQDGRLTYATNLTMPVQLADLADWLVAL